MIPSDTSTKPLSVFLLIMLEFLMGAGAVFGGGALALAPDGALLHMSTTMLQNSPFSDFLLPGLVLFIILGLLPLITAFALYRPFPNRLAEIFNIFRNLHWSVAFTLYTGFIIIIWITVQTYFLQAVHWIHLVYVIWGLLLIAVSLFPSVQKYFAINFHT